MIDKKFIKDCKIINEFDNKNMEYWFDMKRQKFLHNVDTFYYSVRVDADFTNKSEDINYTDFVCDMMEYKLYDDEVNVIRFPDIDEQLNIMTMTFSKYYHYCIECPEMFDIIIAHTVPTDLTPQIIVQIRSFPLWVYGISQSFEKSYKVVKAICKYYNFNIIEVNENRCDYCWHTNYIQDPSTYFRIDNLVKMRVSSLNPRIHYEYALLPNDEYENDYIAQGNRGGKCFLRIYLKTKEVVEKGYKSWFLNEWMFNGLINRYDHYVLEKAYKQKSWNYLDKARLEYYLEYGNDDIYKSLIKDILTEVKKMTSDEINTLARALTPEVTIILNIEYQTMRKMSKSFILQERKKEDERQRIYDYINNRKRIVEYLTHDTFRLVNRKTDINKSRCDYNEFWKRLRDTKMIDCRKEKIKKLVRSNNRKLNSEIVKNRMLHNAITYSLYEKGINNDEVLEDVVNAIMFLNDNDIYNMKKYKNKKKKLLNNAELPEMNRLNFEYELKRIEK